MDLLVSIKEKDTQISADKWGSRCLLQGDVPSLVVNKGLVYIEQQADWRLSTSRWQQICIYLVIVIKF